MKYNTLVVLRDLSKYTVQLSNEDSVYNLSTNGTVNRYFFKIGWQSFVEVMRKQFDLLVVVTVDVHPVCFAQPIME
mgnify:FL=1